MRTCSSNFRIARARKDDVSLGVMNKFETLRRWTRFKKPLLLTSNLVRQKLFQTVLLTWLKFFSHRRRKKFHSTATYDTTKGGMIKQILHGMCFDRAYLHSISATYCPENGMKIFSIFFGRFNNRRAGEPAK